MHVFIKIVISMGFMNMSRFSCVGAIMVVHHFTMMSIGEGVLNLKTLKFTTTHKYLPKMHREMIKCARK